MNDDKKTRAQLIEELETLRRNEGNIVGTFGIWRDITEHKKAEQALMAQGSTESLAGGSV